MSVPAIVSEVLPNELFRVLLEDGRTLIAHVSGKQRVNIVRLRPGDAVTLEISPLDPGRARIVGWQSKSRGSR